MGFFRYLLAKTDQMPLAEIMQIVDPIRFFFLFELRGLGLRDCPFYLSIPFKWHFFGEACVHFLPSGQGGGGIKSAKMLSEGAPSAFAFRSGGLHSDTAQIFVVGFIFGKSAQIFKECFEYAL